MIKAWASVESTLPFISILHFLLSLSFRFGKQRKDERPEDRMERRSSSKSKAEDVQASQEETLRMRLEQER